VATCRVPRSHPDLDKESRRGRGAEDIFPLAHGILFNQLKLDLIYTPPWLVPSRPSGACHRGVRKRGPCSQALVRECRGPQVDVGDRFTSSCSVTLSKSLYLSEPGFLTRQIGTRRPVLRDRGKWETLDAVEM
jgi:hypothetical protein